MQCSGSTVVDQPACSEGEREHLGTVRVCVCGGGGFRLGDASTEERVHTLPIIFVFYNSIR